MTILPGKGQIRLSRILASALLGAGLAATCAAASAAASTARTAATSAATAATAGQSTALVQANVVHRLGVQTAATAPAGYDPADLRSAYNLASAAASGGKGATVAIISVGGDPTAASDLAVYRAQYGLPACTTASACLTKVNATGQASPLPATGTYGPEAASMDMDMVSAICPNCRILLVEADPNSDGADAGPALDAAVGLGAKYVIIAGGNDGYDTPAYDAEYYNHPGVAITVPAGNSGFVSNPATVNFPATSPFVISVGGTTLTKASNARGWTETVWGPVGTNAYYDTSSQCATEFGKPSWQTDAGCAGRTDNDVSAVANPATGVAFYDTTNDLSGWNVGGGTTVAASIVDAVYALAGPPAPDSYPASYPYLNTADLNPVTSGSNVLVGDTCTPAYLCTAGPGYNGPAGWGTPDGTAAFAAPTAPTVALIGPGEQRTLVLPESVSLQLPAQDSAGHPLSYSATGLPPGVAIDPATGVISGTVTSDYDGTVAVTATDTVDPAATATATFPWDAENRFYLDGVAKQQTKPSTQVSLQVSFYEPDKSASISFTATGLPPGLTIDPSTGLISGTTSGAIGSYPVTVTATDSAGTTSTAAFTWDVWNLITVTLPTDYLQSWVGVPVTLAASATDSVPGATLAFSATNLPPGLTINPATGTISGTPTEIGYPFVTVTATDGTGSAGSSYLDWEVGGLITFSRPSARTGVVGQPVSLSLPTHDNAPSDHVNYYAAGLPPGTAIETTAPLITGWLITAGTYHVTVSAEGSYGGSATTSFTWTVRLAPDRGPTGPVRMAADNKCIDDAGNSSANGTKIEVMTCDGKAEQRWTFAEDGTLRMHGKCLDIAGNGLPGSRIRLWNCTGATAEEWTPAMQYAQLGSVASNVCLFDPNWNNGTQLEIAQCRQNLPPRGMRWTLPAGPVLSGMAGKCLDDYHSVKKSGAEIDVAPCNGSAAQNWTFQPDGTVEIFGLCLTSTNSSASEAPLELRGCTQSQNQEWVVYDQTGPGVEITSFQLAIPLNAPPNPEPSPALVQLTYSGGPGLYWHIW